MSSSLRRFWPWALLVAIPLWLIGVTGELRDAWQLEKQGVTVTGRLENPEWKTSRRTRVLDFEAVWLWEGKEFRAPFRLSGEEAAPLLDAEGRVAETRLEMRCVPSRPGLASVALHPPDPWWVQLILACVGLTILGGVTAYLWKQRRAARPRRP